MTRAVNVTGTHLPGADRRRLARQYRRHRKLRRVILAATFGPEAGALYAREEFRCRERALAPVIGSTRWAYFVATRTASGELSIVSILPGRDGSDHLARRHPVVRF